MKFVLYVLLFAVSGAATAKDLFMVRTSMAFPEAMAMLQETITEHGYQVSRVQRVDIGLTSSGYKTDKYRIVFFARYETLQQVARKHQSLLPYLPMKIAIFAERGDTILLASGFSHLRPFHEDDELQLAFDRWETDIASILETVRTAD